MYPPVSRRAIVQPMPLMTNPGSLTTGFAGVHPRQLAPSVGTAQVGNAISAASPASSTWNRTGWERDLGGLTSIFNTHRRDDFTSTLRSDDPGGIRSIWIPRFHGPPFDSDRKSTRLNSSHGSH